MGTNHRTARIVAIIAGLLGAALALATPFLPVNQTTAELNWPQNEVLQSVNAPLIGYVATDLTISVPCRAAAGLAGPQNAGKTVLLSTVPKQAPKAVDRGLLIERVNNDLLVIVRNTPVVSAPLNQVLSPACERLTFTARADKVTAEFVGLVQGPDADNPGELLRGERSGYDFRPQIVGVFTDLAGPAPPGMQFSATLDSRYSTSPTLLKLAVMIVGLAMTVIALGALHVLDSADGTRHRRFLPPRWWSIRPLDVLVIAVLVWWHFVGANTSDDGYILTMARVSEHAGYMANYYRWFGTPEAPFGWYYDLLALWAHVSTNSVRRGRPSGDGATCWWVIGRSDPRLGTPSRQIPWRTDGGRHVPGVLLPLNNGPRRTHYRAGLLLTCARSSEAQHQPVPRWRSRHHPDSHPVLRDRNRGGRSAAGRRRAAENHCGQPYLAIRLPGAVGARACRVHRHDLSDLPRSDLRRGDPGQHVQGGGRA
jgi:arabinosyltransferase C